MFPGPISADFKDLLTRGLTKNPAHRIKLEEQFVHPWVTKQGTHPLPLCQTKTPIEVTLEEIQKAISKRNLESNFFAMAKIGGKLKRKKMIASSTHNLEEY